MNQRRSDPSGRPAREGDRRRGQSKGQGQGQPKGQGQGPKQGQAKGQGKGQGPKQGQPKQGQPKQGQGKQGGHGRGKPRGKGKEVADDPIVELTGPLQKVLGRLPETQRRVLELRMGLVDGYPHDLADTARELGLSMGEARDIEKRAFEHIREAIPLQQLQRFLER